MVRGPEFFYNRAVRLIDTHTHLNITPLIEEVDGVVERARAAGVHWFVVPGLDYATSRKSLELAERHPSIIPTVGLHPLSERDVDLAAFAELAADPPIKAIGEIGTDHKAGDWSCQERWLRFFLELAIRLKKPALIHIRDTWEPTLRVLRDYPELGGRAVVHCFTGGAEEAAALCELNVLISVTAILARAQMTAAREVVKTWPIDRLMLETDSPYLPWPGELWPNEPKTVTRVARLVAELKGLPTEVVATATTKTAEAFFSCD